VFTNKNNKKTTVFLHLKLFLQAVAIPNFFYFCFMYVIRVNLTRHYCKINNDKRQSIFFKDRQNNIILIDRRCFVFVNFCSNDDKITIMLGLAIQSSGKSKFHFLSQKIVGNISVPKIIIASLVSDFT
jgi:hypothetical protein